MEMEQLCYCKRCGRIVEDNINGGKKCDFCKNTIQPVPAEYLYEKCDTIMLSEQEQEFMKKYIWPSLEFDPELHKKMKQWLKTRWDDKPSEKLGNPYGIECPYCHFTFIERTSGANRSMWFADASAVGKQFKCLNCSAFF